MNTVYVYIIEAGQFVKIGVAADPNKRIVQMQTGNPYTLKVIALLPFGSRRQALSEENRLHRHLHKHHFRGEWFYKKCLSDAFRHEINVEMNEKRRNKKKQRIDAAKWIRGHEDEINLVYQARQHI